MEIFYAVVALQTSTSPPTIVFCGPSLGAAARSLRPGTIAAAGPGKEVAERRALDLARKAPAYEPIGAPKPIVIEPETDDVGNDPRRIGPSMLRARHDDDDLEAQGFRHNAARALEESAAA